MNSSRRSLVVLDAPSNLGLMPPRPGHEPGTRFAPAAFRRAGIVGLLDASDGSVVPASPYRHERPTDSRMRNLDGVRSYSLALADALGAMLDARQFPVVLGGDCSILLGSMLALRRRGRFGLVFVDGHTDLLTPETSQTGGAAGMDLALVMGQGHATLSDLDGLAPLVNPSDVVAIGARDGSEHSLDLARQLAGAGASLYSLEDARNRGLATTSQAAVDRLTGAEIAGLWIHLDVDVLDSTLMPAVDSPQPDGQTFDELVVTLRPLLASPAAIGLQVTIFDPELDINDRLAGQLVRALATAFGHNAGPP